MPFGTSDDAWLERRRVSVCVNCRAALAHDQRYCVECGERRDLLARSMADLLGGGRGEDAPRPAGAAAGVVAERVGSSASERPERGGSLRWPGLAWPTPRAAAVAVMGLLAFGVLVGSAVSPVGASDASAPLIVAVAPRAGSATPAATNTESAIPPVTAPVTAPAAAPTSTPATTAPAPAASGGSSASPGSSKPPQIKHVFIVMLADQGYQSTFGPGSSATYLSQTLRSQGEVLPNYYAVAPGELANTIALISGQGPTPQTDADCPDYTDVVPGTTGSLGQVLGSGCVYPASTPTLPSELTAVHKTWRAYVEGIGSGQAQAACAHPALGSADPDQTPLPGNPYVTWRDPFVYFRSITDSSACASEDVGLGQLTSDLKTAATTPSLAYIVPDACHDGSDQPCQAGAASGVTAAEAFLQKLVPEITASPAYRGGGLIAITFDEAPQTGPFADSSGCCETPPYPNVPAGAPGTATPGSGASGATAATGASGPTESTAATGASDPTGATATTGSSGSTGATGSSGSTGATGSSDSSGTTGSTGVTGAATTGTSSSGSGGLVSTGAGGQVGLLLLSQDVTPASVDPTLYNHFSLLRSIEAIFGLPAIGYAAASGLPVFNSQVYNAGSSG